MTLREPVPAIRGIGLRSLARMYLPDEKLFAFRLRKAGGGIVREGISLRYTAITLIGLAAEEEEPPARILAGHGLRDVCSRLMEGACRSGNLGDVALAAWAAHAVGSGAPRKVWDRLFAFRPADEPHATVEVAWALAALCEVPDLDAGVLRARLASRLVTSLGRRSGLFPHTLGATGAGMRSHVSCFADIVYPVHALSRYFERYGDRAALDAAAAGAERICRLQGDSGQWWWHYDWRTGKVIEGYPVYAIHQDAMAPMALFALSDAGGPDFTGAVHRGLHWLESSPELGGRSLIDRDADLVWRKVGRREPGKVSRYLQAAAARIHPSLRAPGLDALFPPTAIDYEDRPYHIGWFLYAWRRTGSAGKREDGSR